ncbi:MAG: hypothetical protein IT524_02090 [Nitrosomonas sp.]|nr:hypothetical protein [Nitrosomonas sp.]
MNIKQTAIIMIVLAVIPQLSGCWAVAAAGAGAYGGYQMKKEGYTLQTPVTKEEEKKTNK